MTYFLIYMCCDWSLQGYFTNLKSINRWIRIQIFYTSIFPLDPFPPNHIDKISISSPQINGSTSVYFSTINLSSYIVLTSHHSVYPQVQGIKWNGIILLGLSPSMLDGGAHEDLKWILSDMSDLCLTSHPSDVILELSPYSGIICNSVKSFC